MWNTVVCSLLLLLAMMLLTSQTRGPRSTPLLIQLVVVAGLFLVAVSAEDGSQDDVTQLLAKLEDLQSQVKKLTRQTMLQQFAVEERSRLHADSGIKLIRSRTRGLKNYETPSYIGHSVNAIHDHANYIRTIGMGEVAVAMNGVEFRTRHNDYKLVMPSTTSDEYQATEDIPFPDVPPSIQGTIQEQTDEIIQWFKAFKTQNKTERDYTKYFKPVLCYMEGYWTVDTDQIKEPFRSERHKIDAGSWFELHEKVKYSVQTGTKNANENLAYLPTTIMSVNDTGVADFAQWNYRILCQPLKQDVPFSSLQYVEDLTYRIRKSKSKENTLLSRGARFKLYNRSRSDAEELLDHVFYTVPGLDNMNASNVRQESLGDGDLYEVTDGNEDVILKSGFYHRQYKYNKKGAMGLTENPRAFNDDNCWMAQTTQSKIAPVCVEYCQRELKSNGKKRFVCRDNCLRFTYAIPLEIVYLTPLLTWNPYNITIHQDHTTAVLNKANGYAKPFNGADFNRYYLTPAEMFGGRSDRDAADTVRKAAKIYDSQGVVRSVAASGTKILTDDIPGVGPVRLRYPIAPVADEGSSVWKELNAFKDYVYDVLDNTDMPGSVPAVVEPTEVNFVVWTRPIQDPPGEHTHDISISFEQFEKLVVKGWTVWAKSEMAQGHEHKIGMKFDKETKRFYYKKCGGKALCWDGHGPDITLVSTNVDIDQLLMDAESRR